MKNGLRLILFLSLTISPAFAAMDATADGKVQLEELIDFMLGKAPFEKRDRNLDGYLDSAELPGLTNEQQLAVAYDGNKDGKLDPIEYRDYVADFAIAAMASCDADGNDYLSGAEIKCGFGRPTPD